MNNTIKVIIGVIVIALIGWLILRALNADHREQIQLNYTKIAEDKNKLLELRYDSLIVKFDSIINAKDKVDSILMVSLKERNYLKQKLYEARKNFNYDSSAVFIKQYLSTKPEYVQ